MKRILIVFTVFASLAAATAQTKPAQKKAEVKECCKSKKECTKEEKATNHCSPSNKAKMVSAAKKPVVKKG